MKFAPTLLAAALLLAACHSDDIPADERQMVALNASTDRWRSEYPDLYGEANATAQRRALAVMLPAQIQIDQFGFFYFEQPHGLYVESSDIQFICRGNIERRTIEFVGHGDELRRPNAGTVWSF